VANYVNNAALDEGQYGFAGAFSPWSQQAWRSFNGLAKDDAVAAGKRETKGRGVDVVIESAGSASAFRITTEAVRPGGQVIWLGKIDVNSDVSFRWGSLMQEKRIRRVSYGNARPRRDFPLLARAYLDGSLMLDDLISCRIKLEEINEGFAALKRGETIRSVIMFD